MKTLLSLFFLSVAAIQAQTNTNTAVAITITVTLNPAQVEWLDRTISVTNSAHGTSFTRESYLVIGEIGRAHV